MASDEFSDGGNHFDWDVLRKRNGEHEYVREVRIIKSSIKMIEETLAIQEGITTNKYLLTGLKNDIAYKHERIESIMGKHPEYFI